jgi:hypothetical protein
LLKNISKAIFNELLTSTDIMYFSQVQQLESDQRRSIAKSSVYFSEKDASERMLNEQKLLVEKLQRDVAAAKQEYAAALHRLEAISDEIHCRRAKGPREPGVGAELSAEPMFEVAPVPSTPQPHEHDLIKVPDVIIILK